MSPWTHSHHAVTETPADQEETGDTIPMARSDGWMQLAGKTTHFLSLFISLICSDSSLEDLNSLAASYWGDIRCRLAWDSPGSRILCQ